MKRAYTPFSSEQRETGFLLVLLLALAIFVRSAIPVGFMPDIGSGSFFKMTVCSLDGPKTVLVDKDLNPVSEPSHSDDHEAQPCEFSFLSHSPLSFAASLASVLFVALSYENLLFMPDYSVELASTRNIQAQPRAPPILI